MRRLLLLLLVLLLPAPAAGAKESCLTRGRTLAVTERVRVFSTHGGGVHHVCDVRRRRSRRIGENADGADAIRHAHFVAAGRFLAFEYVACDRYDGCAGTVEVVDGTKARARWLSGPAPGEVVDLRVNRLGQAAYMTKEADVVSVRAVTRAGALLLASGTAVDPFSLALGDGVVYWTDAGEPRSRTL